MNKILAILLFALSMFSYSSAQCPTYEQWLKALEKVEKEEREFQVYCGYQRSDDTTYVDVRFRIIGNGWYADKNGDSIVGIIGYSSKGNRPLEPKSLLFRIHTVSLQQSKYLDGETLSIFVDDKELLSGPLRITRDWTTGWTMKTFDFGRISYVDFLKIVQTNKATFQISGTKMDIGPNEHQRLRDMNAVIEKPD